MQSDGAQEAGKSPGQRFRAALKGERPLQIVGVIHAYAAIMAEKCGFRALYLSGAGVANASFGVPDLGITSLTDVVEDVRRITGATALPLLVDADTGWEESFSVEETVVQLAKAGTAAIHLEDQVPAKRCGHLAGKQLVPASKMTDRIKRAVDAKPSHDFFIMARTDAAAVEGLDKAIERAQKYCAAGADGIFAEALTSLDQYEHFARAIDMPLLANLTEFGKTPQLTLDELRAAGVSVALYPLSAFRAMNAAALKVYRAIREKGTQSEVIDMMQTRAELYEFLDYESYERQLDQLLGAKSLK
jgi:methylisocitrate lyase